MIQVKSVVTVTSFACVLGDGNLSERVIHRKQHGNDRDQREGLHSLQISFVWLCVQCCRSPGAGQTAAVAGHEGCTPYL